MLPAMFEDPGRNLEAAAAAQHVMSSVKSILLAISVVAFVATLVSACFQRRSEHVVQKSDPLVFVGDARCESCHKSQHGEWKTSDHFRSMLPASDTSIAGDFSNVTFSGDGVTSRFYRSDGKFFIETEGPQGRNEVYQVAYSFGYYPLQQYLISFPGGRMQVPRVSWDAAKKTWFHQYEGQNIAHKDWLHWTRDAQNWNTMCASCHSTNLVKNYDAEHDTYNTTFSSVNVSCESCHGAGSRHVALMESSQDPGSLATREIIKLAGQSAQITGCMPCHARRGEISPKIIASREMLDNWLPEIPVTENFYPDGQIRDEVFIYTSFLQSKMMQHGVTCTDCHDSHSGRLRAETNALCLSCHSSSYNARTHHFHNEESEGAECRNCHMPGKIYMGNDYRHDHSFRVPRPDLSSVYGTPDACTACHKGKSAQWAADVIVKKLGKTRKYHFADDLLPGSLLNKDSEYHLRALLQRDSVPAIIIASALAHLGSLKVPGNVGVITSYLGHGDALVRYHALRALSGVSSDYWLQAALPKLRDNVRAVRIAAADLFVDIPDEALSPAERESRKRAARELKEYLHHQADFADGNILIGDHYLRTADHGNAQKYYERAIRKDSLLNYARLNLSVAYSAAGDLSQALNVLKTAAVITPENDRVFYNLGLLYTEMGDTLAALASFDRSIRLRTKEARVFYNYGLLLYHRKDPDKAIAILNQGLGLSSTDEQIHYALAFIHIKEKRSAVAARHVEILLAVDSANSAYRNLARAVR